MTRTQPRSRAAVESALAVPRQARSQIGLEKMLQAGRELIEASGNLDDLSIKDIVERSGTSIGAFYRRFDSKDMFFDVVLDRAMTEGRDRIRDMVASDSEWRSGDARKVADAIVEMYVQLFRRNRGLFHASLLRVSRPKATWDIVKEANRDVLALIVPPLVAAHRERTQGEKSGRRADRVRGTSRAATDPGHAGQYRPERPGPVVADEPPSRALAEDTVLPLPRFWPRPDFFMQKRNKNSGSDFDLSDCRKETAMTPCCAGTSRQPAFDAPHIGEPLDVAFDAGVNLAFAIAAPTVPPRLTEHSRRMAQRIYRVAERVYCAVGYAIANIIFVVGDDGIVVIDTTEAVSAAKRIYEDFCAIDPRHAQVAGEGGGLHAQPHGPHGRRACVRR